MIALYLFNKLIQKTSEKTIYLEMTKYVVHCVLRLILFDLSQSNKSLIKMPKRSFCSTLLADYRRLGAAFCSNLHGSLLTFLVSNVLSSISFIWFCSLRISACLAGHWIQKQMSQLLKHSQSSKIKFLRNRSNQILRIDHLSLSHTPMQCDWESRSFETN